MLTVVVLLGGQSGPAHHSAPSGCSAGGRPLSLLRMPFPYYLQPPDGQEIPDTWFPVNLDYGSVLEMTKECLFSKLNPALWPY